MAVEQNAAILRRVLDDALNENPDNFLLHDDMGHLIGVELMVCTARNLFRLAQRQMPSELRFANSWV
jgi:hypothetical protein